MVGDHRKALAGWLASSGELLPQQALLTARIDDLASSVWLELVELEDAIVDLDRLERSFRDFTGRLSGPSGLAEP